MIEQELKIRSATEDDYDGACRLYREVDALHADMLPAVFREVEGPPRPREHFVEKLTSPTKAVFVAEWRGELCGLTDVQEEATPPYPMFVPTLSARIDNLVVAEAWRRKGVARALLEEVRHWARERRIEKIQLSVYTKNAGAMAFYEDAGFTPVHQRLELEL